MMIDEHRKDLERLRDELIQVAAVAAAICEDLEFGIADYDRLAGNDPDLPQGKVVMGRILDERRRQDKIWGPQHHEPAVWLAILMEEVGEAAEDVSANYAQIGDSADPTAEGLLWYLIFEVRRIGREAQRLLQEVLFP